MRRKGARETCVTTAAPALRVPPHLNKNTSPSFYLRSLQHQLPAYGGVGDYLRKTPNNITITYHKSLVSNNSLVLQAPVQQTQSFLTCPLQDSHPPHFPTDT